MPCSIKRLPNAPECSSAGVQSWYGFIYKLLFFSAWHFFNPAAECFYSMAITQTASERLGAKHQNNTYRNLNMHNKTCGRIAACFTALYIDQIKVCVCFPLSVTHRPLRESDGSAVRELGL